MHHFFIGAGIALLGMIVLIFVRAIKGPTAMDRLVSVNMIGTKATVILVLMGIVFGRVDMFVDLAIGYGLLNFIASIAASKFFFHHKTMHPEKKWNKEIDRHVS